MSQVTRAIPQWFSHLSLDWELALHSASCENVVTWVQVIHFARSVTNNEETCRTSQQIHKAFHNKSTPQLIALRIRPVAPQYRVGFVGHVLHMSLLIHTYNTPLIKIILVSPYNTHFYAHIWPITIIHLLAFLKADKMLCKKRTSDTNNSH